MGIPSGLRDIESSCKGTGFVTVMGVIVDFMPPSPTRGTDWQATFSIADHQSTYEGQRIKIFAPRGKLPQIRGTGDVVMLRDFKIKDFRGLVLLSNHTSGWTVFPCSAIPDSINEGQNLSIEYTSSSSTKKPGQQEMSYAVELCNLKARDEWTSLTAPHAPDQAISGSRPPPVIPFREKFALIEAIGVQQYYDIVGQVVKIYSLGDRLDLYITDYTENSLLYNYGAEDEATESGGREGDEFAYLAPQQKKLKDWKGPLGRYTLQVTLFHPHSSYALHKVHVGDYVLLRNVHAKLAKDPRYCRLEGALHTDKLFPDKIDVEKLIPENEGRVKALLMRKRDFLATHRQQLGNLDDKKPSGLKRSGSSDKKPPGKRQRNKKDTGSKHPDPATKPDAPPKPASAQAARLEPNKHIVAAYPDQPARTLADINATEATHAFTAASGTPVLLPFQNLLFRAKARVVDFRPRDIANFAVRTSEFDCLPDPGAPDDDPASYPTPPGRARSPSLSSDDDVAGDGDGDDSSTPRRKRWTWFFTLLLEDAGAPAGRARGDADRVAVHVAGADAEFLLGLNATNLRRRPAALARLREKLFLLWGDLEEHVEREAAAERHALDEASGNGGKGKEGGRAGGGGVGRAPAGKPFLCCLKEYGVRARGGGWERRFRMFGTSIQ